MVASLVSYKTNGPPPVKRGRPPKIIYDIDTSKSSDEVIYDQKNVDDGMPGKTGTRKSKRKRTYG